MCYLLFFFAVLVYSLCGVFCGLNTLVRVYAAIIVSQISCTSLTFSSYLTVTVHAYCYTNVLKSKSTRLVSWTLKIPIWLRTLCSVWSYGYYILNSSAIRVVVRLDQFHSNGVWLEIGKSWVQMPVGACMFIYAGFSSLVSITCM